MNVFDELINLIHTKRKEINVNIDSKKISEFIPKVYYIGNGKCGSTSIKTGFSNINVAHWHNINYFENLYQTKLLSSNNLDLYDLIIYIGNKYNFKPVIIECLRNTINYEISKIFQHIKYDRNHKYECEFCKIKKYKYENNINDIIKIVKNHIYNEIHALPYSCKMFKKHFNIDLLLVFDKKLNYYFNKINNVYLLFLKFEDIKNWEKIINNNLPYKFSLKHSNKTADEFYEIIKKNFKYTKKEIEPILESKKISYFYSDNEINFIKKNFILNKL